MAAELTFGDMARTFERMAADQAAIDEAILETIGERVQARARSYLGVPQYAGHGGFPPWAPLSPLTLDKKGQIAPGTPLIETGELGESLEIEKLPPSSVAVGTSLLSERGEPYPKYLEEGTSEMPPRPYLHPAALEVVGEMLEEIGEALVLGSGAIGRRRA